MTDILHIAEGDKPLNKKQKEFNQLSAAIEALDAQVAELRDAYEEMLRRMPLELDPVVREYQGYRVEMVKLWDRNYEAEHFRRAYQTKLAYLITESAYELISHYRFDELKPVFNKYSKVNIDVLLDQERQRNTARIEDPAFLLESENKTKPDIPFHDLPKAEQERLKAERREQKANQRMQEAHQSKITKSVRSVYMELVKSFHPDREQDELEKQRKTENMQRITEAYQENNLLGLLKLQMELEQIDRSKLDGLGKNQLSYYNKILREQLDELEQHKIQVQKQISALCGLPFQHANSKVTVIARFNGNINDLKLSIKEIKQILRHWQVPSQLKAYLKTYQIPNQPDDELDD